jgi:alkanesulfonate monooxygenase SsuD/methylene tetrahydromethanopterin reductase-like flavin-dependent oxidoreductase (luciferase family)
MDLLEQSLRVEQRLAKLVPPPVRKIPILIGGGGIRRSLPIVARHADIWHTFASVADYCCKNAILKDLATDAGRDKKQVVRAVHWTGRENADAFVAEGATLFTAEIHPTDDGYDFAELKDMIAGRESLDRR